MYFDLDILPLLPSFHDYPQLTSSSSSSTTGQMVASEILMASESGCPIEMHKIEIAKCDEMYDKDCKGGQKMPFHRAIYDSATGQSPNLPREQVRSMKRP
jgi:hypothetical protein